MKTKVVLIGSLFCLSFGLLNAQVGVNNTNPQASLDVEASNVSTPTNTDGILIPRVSAFPSTSPTAAQDGMLIFYTGSGASGKGFYYWNQTSTSWEFLASGSKNTLDAAYDEGGSGFGRIITADNGAIEIQGNGGLRVEDDIVAASNIIHDGDTNTFMTFTPDRIQFDAGGRNYMDIQHSGTEVAFNEDSTQSDFRVESGDETHMLFVDGSEDRVGINRNNPLATLHVVGNVADNGNVVDIDATNRQNGIDINLNGSSTEDIDNVDGIAITQGIDFTGNGSRPSGLTLNMNGSSTSTSSSVRAIDISFPGSSNYLGNVFGNYVLNLASSDMTFYGNFVSAGSSSANNYYGSYNAIGGNSTGDVYGTYNIISGTGSGEKYGSYNTIASTTSGTHYGVYSNVQNVSSYAGYFIGRMELGNTTTNRYLMPGADGTSGQVMTTNGTGALSWADPNSLISNDDDWTVSGSDQYATTTGNVGIGDTTPDAKLDIEYTGSQDNGVIIDFAHGISSNPGTALSITAQRSAGSTRIYGADINVLNSTGSGSVGLDINNSADSTENFGLGSIVTGNGSTNYGLVSIATGSITNWAGYFGNSSFLNSGNVYIQDLLHTDGSFRYTDGSQALGYVLSTDASGNGTWTDPATLFSDTDNQQIDVLSLAGTTLQLSLQDDGVATQTLNLASIDTDNQQIDVLNLNGTDLEISLQDDGIATQTLDLSSLAAADTDWVDNGSDIERQSGDVYIGDTNGTNNNLYISNRLIDWDDNSFYIDPGSESFVNEINFDAGSTTDPGIHFDADTNTGFYRPEQDAIGFTSNGTARMQFTSRGQIEFGNTGRSIFLGNQAGEADDFTNNNNIGIGDLALTSTTNGDFNIGIGYLALTNNTFGVSNIAIGESAMESNIDGFRNVSIGENSLFENEDGDFNVAIGFEALRDNNSNNNLGIGLSAGALISSGTRNIAIGTRAQANHTGGDDNVVIGSGALDTSTSSSNNIAIGSSTLTNLTAGSNNVAIGHTVMGNNSGGIPNEANNNVIIGYQAAQFAEGDGNIFIGYQAAQSAGVVSDRLIIENSNANTSNALIYGEFDNDLLRFNASVGIGRVAATNALEVEGDASKTTAGAFIANSDRRLKKNINRIIGTTALEKLSQLNGVTYEWNDTKTGTKRPEGIQYGFIAQNIQEVFPEKVTTDNLGYLQTAYGDYDPLVIEAIKELKAQIEELKNENSKLKQQLTTYESLDARLTALEATLPRASQANITLKNE